MIEGERLMSKEVAGSGLVRNWPGDVWAEGQDGRDDEGEEEIKEGDVG
jgi:hypothetical protein